MQTKTPIIPIQQHLVGTSTALDHKAICVFVGIGFFLDDETYFTDLKTLRPATVYEINDTNKNILSSTPYFKWHHSPEDMSLETAVHRFQELFEGIISQTLKDRQVILPLSGGLDSRTLAVALKRLGIPTHSFSYAFEGGHDETLYGKKIAERCDFNFAKFEVPKGYLWQHIEKLADINQCYSEFTNPRQMAFIDQYKALGDTFALGHWGDVLFDDMGVNDTIAIDEQVEVLIKKLQKPGTFELAELLWKNWNLSGTFSEHLKEKIYHLLKNINIPESANAQIRAFKSLHWAPRWTSVNLSIFEHACPVEVPYYSNRLCEFICTIPEAHLSQRQIQIAYIKKYMPQLARVTWQDHRPFNLYNYHLNKVPWNLPYRIVKKLERTFQSKTFIQRNWELQFVGDENLNRLRAWIVENDHLNELVPKTIREEIYTQFEAGEHYKNAYPLSMLLTLSLFSSKRHSH